MTGKGWQALEAEAKAHLARGEIGKAAHLLIDAIDLAPEQVDLYRQLVQVALLAGGTDTAVKAATELRRLEPNNPEAGYLLAVASMAHGDFALAETTLDAAARQAPRSWQIRQAQAQVARALKKEGQARQALEEAVALAPSEPSVVNDYAVLLLELDEPARAKDVLAKALASHPDEAGLHLNLALAYGKLEDVAKAKLHAERAKTAGDADVREQAARLLAQLSPQ
ncbi:MAG: tetratricopeptide repeat protein [Myxococcus sp.]|nr:tetratricopeptide repeat protein [Myxococcus sp.]